MIFCKYIKPGSSPVFLCLYMQSLFIFFTNLTCTVNHENKRIVKTLALFFACSQSVSNNFFTFLILAQLLMLDMLKTFLSNSRFNNKLFYQRFDLFVFLICADYNVLFQAQLQLLKSSFSFFPFLYTHYQLPCYPVFLFRCYQMGLPLCNY
jgi:hypothetical protein